MNITFDPAKRMATLGHRGLDFADAALVFEGRTATNPATGKDYGEPRFITAGLQRACRGAGLDAAIRFAAHHLDEVRP